MCHIGYLSHLYSTTYIQGWYLFTGIYLPLESKHLPVGCIHAYLRVVHPGVTLAFRESTGAKVCHIRLELLLNALAVLGHSVLAVVQPVHNFDRSTSCTLDQTNNLWLQSI